MLAKHDVRRLARARLADAEVLHERRRYDSAIYLCGYAVELGLKTRICRILKWNGYPWTRKEFEGLQSFRTHDLDLLSPVGPGNECRDDAFRGMVGCFAMESRRKIPSHRFRLRNRFDDNDRSDEDSAEETMNELADAVGQAERAMADEKGQFTLFALFLRQDAPNVWDVVVSSPWVESDRAEALRYISAKLRAHLTDAQLTQLSRIVLVEPSSPSLDAIRRFVRAEHSAVEVKDSVFFGLDIKHGYIIAVQRDAA